MTVTIDILGSVEKLAWGVVAQVLQFVGFVIVAALVPAILIALPLYLIWQNPSQDLTWLAQIFFWTAPLSCAFWMLVPCHWQSVRQWQRMGRLSSERQKATRFPISTDHFGTTES